MVAKCERNNSTEMTTQRGVEASASFKLQYFNLHVIGVKWIRGKERVTTTATLKKRRRIWCPYGVRGQEGLDEAYEEGEKGEFGGGGGGRYRGGKWNHDTDVYHTATTVTTGNTSTKGLGNDRWIADICGGAGRTSEAKLYENRDLSTFSNPDTAIATAWSPYRLLTQGPD
ncbi:hypothetical protein C8R41DRAFT_863430 [Lentinula lateritia]|uniref:Uncharacterized protein n=1 Tax=Lentinula lateritia TaxID=40482 RepID=A0ABQ8VVQ7_9AGAR|nr:hypothetical protein C8R41DRAFT_863430 [Lentinula lateritia]